jgi:uncharacterized protein YdcH (DUF465 family)
MSKTKYYSELLNQNSKKIGKMIAASPEFSKFVQEYEATNKKIKQLKEKASLSEEETIELQKLKTRKVYEKDYICQQIEAYKKDSQLWVQSNGPSIIKDKEQTA